MKCSSFRVGNAQFTLISSSARGSSSRPHPVCPAEITLGLISGRWKLTIISHLAQRTMRFSELISAIAGVSRRILTQQLRQLEQVGLIHREVFAQVPPKVEYSLTELGKTLIPVVEMMGAWAEANTAQYHDQEDNTPKGQWI